MLDVLSQHLEKAGFSVISAKNGKPRTTDLRPWLWGASLAGSSEHSSPRSRTGRSVVLGKQGMAKAIKKNPHLILMDVMLPGMDGLIATRRIRSNPKINDIPILAITALFREQELRGCIEAGCNDYIVKPFTYEKLMEKIQELPISDEKDW